MRSSENSLLVVLSSLCAEGTPVLVLDLCRRWKAQGISPVVATLADQPTDLESEFRAAGVPLRSIGLPPSGRARFAKLTVAMFRLCRELRPSAVLSMPLGWHGFMFLGARAAGVRVTAAHVGNYPPVQLPKALRTFRLLIQTARPFTNRLICCSSYIRKGVEGHFGVPGDETELIYNGVDVEAVRVRASTTRAVKRDGVPFVVGMVARLEVHKDQPTLIRAARLLKDANSPVEVWLLGEGSRREEYQRLIADLGLENEVKLLGMRRDIPELLGQMDVFAFSAKPDEGLGVALIEAMAAEVPIIATDVGACREVLQDGEFGTLVPPGDPKAMAEAIASAFRDRSANRSRLEGASRRAREVFSIEQMARDYARCLMIGR